MGFVWVFAKEFHHFNTVFHNGKLWFFAVLLRFLGFPQFCRGKRFSTISIDLYIRVPHIHLLFPTDLFPLCFVCKPHIAHRKLWAIWYGFQFQNALLLKTAPLLSSVTIIPQSAQRSLPFLPARPQSARSHHPVLRWKLPPWGYPNPPHAAHRS